MAANPIELTQGPDAAHPITMWDHPTNEHLDFTGIQDGFTQIGRRRFIDRACQGLAGLFVASGAGEVIYQIVDEFRIQRSPFERMVRIAIGLGAGAGAAIYGYHNVGRFGHRAARAAQREQVLNNAPLNLPPHP